MLFVHEVHKVVGKCAARFEDAYRSGWMPILAQGDDARLLWYLDLAHGSGLAYRAVTVTAVTDGAAWARLADRVAGGDLQTWARHLDGLQHESRGRIMTPLEWSPALAPLAEIPTDPIDHEPTMYMEDTMWPFPGKVNQYVRASGDVYRRALAAEGSQVQMSIELATQTMPGAGRYPEVTLMQKLSSIPRLVRLLTSDIPEEVTRPGSWMHEALELRDQWQSRLLRSATWSPLPHDDNVDGRPGSRWRPAAGRWEMNVGHATDASLERVPDRVALVVEGASITYRRLETLIGRAAAALAARGVGPGDRVALVDLGSALSVATIYGAARLGAATAQMNAYLTPGELAQLTELVGARVGVAGSRFAEGLRVAVDGPVLGADDVIGDDGDGGGGGGVPTTVGDDADTALVLFTSGTTGLPKPIAISHGVVTDRLAYYAKPIDPDAAQLVDMMSAPIFHIGGTLGLFISLHSGKKMVLLPKFEAGEWLSLVERHRVNQTFVVPAMLRRILDHPRFDSSDLSSLRALSYGAAAAPVDLIRRAVAALPDVDFSNTFGQTETLGAYAALTPDDHRRGDRYGSVGRPFPGVEVKIVDPSSGDPVVAGTVGEFVVRADQNTTSEWLRTGDTGWQDAEGYLYPSGRLSDTINRGGEKFGPVEVEDVLRTHPSVVDVGVVGVPDDDLGERVGAVVVAGEPVSAESLVGYSTSQLATYKVPEYLEFASELPFSALGKLDRKALRALLSHSPAVRTGS